MYHISMISKNYVIKQTKEKNESKQLLNTDDILYENSHTRINTKTHNIEKHPSTNMWKKSPIVYLNAFIQKIEMTAGVDFLWMRYLKCILSDMSNDIHLHAMFLILGCRGRSRESGLLCSYSILSLNDGE